MKIVNHLIGTHGEYPTNQKSREISDKSFEEIVRGAINHVSDLQNEADNQIEAFLRGDPVDLHNVMISLEKANINFRLITEIRNKALTAYEEIMKMPV